jgi:hypothetical protein
MDEQAMPPRASGLPEEFRGRQGSKDYLQSGPNFSFVVMLWPRAASRTKCKASADGSWLPWECTPDSAVAK